MKKIFNYILNAIGIEKTATPKMNISGTIYRWNSLDKRSYEFIINDIRDQAMNFLEENKKFKRWVIRRQFLDITFHYVNPQMPNNEITWAHLFMWIDGHLYSVSTESKDINRQVGISNILK